MRIIDNFRFMNTYYLYDFWPLTFKALEGYDIFTKDVPEYLLIIYFYSDEERERF
jgi:hypothetical protein